MRPKLAASNAAPSDVEQLKRGELGASENEDHGHLPTRDDPPAFVDNPAGGTRRQEVHMSKRKRRLLTKEFKADTVRLVREGGRSAKSLASSI